MDNLDISKEEWDMLQKFRERVADIVTPQHHNRYLIRWLRARELDLNKAEKMFRDSMAWRKEWSADSLRDNWKAPEILKKYFTCSRCGVDKEQIPVFLDLLGQCDVRGQLRCVSRADLIRHIIWCLELGEVAMEEETERQNRPVTKMSVIIDMDGFTLSNIGGKQAVDMVLHAAQMYEANYPDRLKTAYIINAPRVFALVFSMIRPFLSEHTLKKLRMFGPDPDKWKAELLNDIPADQLPKHWGGTKVDPETGDPKCPKEIVLGGEVPKNLYISNREKHSCDSSVHTLTPVTIHQGSSYRHKVNVTLPGSTIRWEFRTEHHDISFCVLKTSECGEKEIEMILPKRVDSHISLEEGSLLCLESGTYTLVFDNTFSYFRSKYLHFWVTVEEPSHATGNGTIMRAR